MAGVAEVGPEVEVPWVPVVEVSAPDVVDE